jgi:hypothetical protein
MVASITQVRSILSFLMNQILIFYCRSQIFGLYYIFKRSISYLCVTVSPCILATRQQYVLGFLYVYFKTNLLTSVN